MERWLPVIGYEGKYEISDYGRVKSLKRKHVPIDKILKPTAKQDGYLVVSLRYYGLDQRYVHALVAKHFIGESNLTVDHIDGNQKNNRLDNLEYVTMCENNRRKFKGGRIGVHWNSGRQNWRARITQNGKRFRIGDYKDKEAAYQAYYNKYVEIHGVVPWVN